MQKEIKKEVGAIHILDKVDLKLRAVTRDKEGRFIMIKGTIKQVNRILVNIYEPNVGAPKL